MADDFWFGELLRVDLSALLSRAAEPFLVLNTHGELVFANKALESLLGESFSLGSAIGKPAPDFLARPSDLRIGEVCRSVRPYGPPRSTRWLEFLFFSLTESSDQEIGVLASVCRAEAPPQVKPSLVDSLSERLVRHRENQLARWGFEALPAVGLAMQKVMSQLRFALAASEPVSIIGEGGTGKTSLAKILHYQTVGAKGPLRALDCRTLPWSTQAEQLLGIAPEQTKSSANPTAHQRAALAGGDIFDSSPVPAPKIPAITPSPTLQPTGKGLLALQGPGTILLENVGGVALEMQRAVVDWIDRRAPVSRLIATERVPLEKLLAAGTLLDELYHRLTALSIQLPNLRDRPLELDAHCAWVLDQWNKQPDRAPVGIDPAAMTMLSDYDWPGNLHELKTVLEQAAEKATASAITPRDLPKRIRKTQPGPAETSPTPKPKPLPSLDKTLEDVERRLLQLALDQSNNNKSKAADSLSISRPRLLRRLEQLGLLRNSESTPERSGATEAKEDSRPSDSV